MLSVPRMEEATRAGLGNAVDFSVAVLQSGADGSPALTLCHRAPRPLLPVYSVTKTFIAALVLDAVARRRLTLEQTLETVFPDLPDAGQIRVAQLLDHTGGLPDYAVLPEYQQAVRRGDPAWNFDAFADATYRRGLAYPPGLGWRYSNSGYALLRVLLERTEGCSLAELIHNRIAKPLGLERTRVISSLDAPDICRARSRQLHPEGQPRSVNDCYDPGWVWHGLMVSDAADCARWLQQLLAGSWLESSLVQRMMELRPVPEQHPPWHQPSYGLGLMGEPHGPRGALHGHTGSGPGFSAAVYRFADNGIVVAVLAASEATGAVEDVMRTLYDEALAA